MSESPNPYASPQIPAPQVSAQPAGTEVFVPCPSCGNTFSKRVGFTWWGGALGPRMFTHVRCARCGQAYNGKSGKSNATAIAIYVAVTTAIGLAIGIALALAGAFG